VDCRDPGAWLSGRAFFRTSRMARLRLRGLGFAVASYTWASRGETLVPTLAAQTVLRVRIGRPLTRPMYLSGLRPLHLCGTRLEGGHQGLSRRYGRLDGEPLGVGVATEAGRYGGRADTSFPARRAFSSPLRYLARTISTRWGRPFGDGDGDEPATEARCFVGSTHTNLRDGKSLRCPPSRRVPHKWSGRRPYQNMGRAAAFPLRNAEDCLSSEGGHRRLCAANSTPAAPAAPAAA
jgi:hypothetical protein